MSELHIKKIAEELKLRETQVLATIRLLDEEATVPFIARYRKEATGSLDEVQITSIRDRSHQLRELDKRREAILSSLTERELLTDELKEKIEAAETMTVLEDIYLPFRPKRRTRATIAKEKGLEPLALQIFEQGDIDIQALAAEFIDSEKEVNTVDEALAGARDIIAEMINENQQSREKIRELFSQKGVMQSEVIPGKEEEGNKYKDYFEWSEPVTQAPSHRILALMRGQREGVLFLKIEPSEEEALKILERLFVKKENSAGEQTRIAAKDGYRRLLSTSMETEIRMMLKDRADIEAINVFAENLRQLLLAPPLGRKNIMAIDPGFRTGCKVVCLDKQGKLLFNDTIYPHPPQDEVNVSGTKVKMLAEKFMVETIAVGNGTAGRETEAFLRKLDFGREIPVIMVNESGASIYSASEAAREEFSEYDLTVRGAVSIGRRLMDPLAELVKIDPKSIGVGQYQHDVDQNLLKKSLDDIVISCVNAVGVEINTASKELLTYVSGLNSRIAKSIVEYRNTNGPFKTREEFTNVPYMGPKAFEQASGFLRIQDATNPLDSSAVHPEAYPIVFDMAKDLGCDVKELMQKEDIRKKIDIKKYVNDKIGLPTLQDIVNELAKPGRDPRKQLEIFKYDENVQTIEDLKPGMKLPGIVTNITAFGAFVDIGVHQDGLVHISQLSDSFIKDPNEAVKVHQNVMVTVIEVDAPRKRISLSMKKDPDLGIKTEGKAPGKKAVVKKTSGVGQVFDDRKESNKPFTIGDLMNKFNK